MIQIELNDNEIQAYLNVLNKLETTVAEGALLFNIAEKIRQQKQSEQREEMKEQIKNACKQDKRFFNEVKKHVEDKET